MDWLDMEIIGQVMEQEYKGRKGNKQKNLD